MLNLNQKDSLIIVCKRCKRKLKNQEARERGYGSCCFRKITKKGE